MFSLLKGRGFLEGARVRGEETAFETKEKEVFEEMKEEISGARMKIKRARKDREVAACMVLV